MNLVFHQGTCHQIALIGVYARLLQSVLYILRQSIWLCPIGAYQDSAGFVNRLPTSAIFQPDEQQKGFIFVQVQYFWKSQNPIPDLDQSVARHVTLDLS